MSRYSYVVVKGTKTKHNVGKDGRVADVLVSNFLLGLVCERTS